MDRRNTSEATRHDTGFTLIELLIVIVILGVLATVTVFAARGVTTKGQTSACSTDKTTIQTATESYFAQYGSGTGVATGAYAAGYGYAGSTAQVAVAAPAGVAWVAGASPRDTLMNAGLLRSVPTNFFVLANGQLVISNAGCGTIGTNIG